MIATKIEELCKKNGITFAELERTVGIGNGLIRKWDGHDPRVSSLKKVADYFGVTMDELCRE